MSSLCLSPPEPSPVAADRFHVNDLSSAHVYLRLPVGKGMDDIPEPILTDCAQLVKANSIQGNKLNNVEIVYTPHPNLKKTGSMEVGQARLPAFFTSATLGAHLWRQRYEAACGALGFMQLLLHAAETDLPP